VSSDVPADIRLNIWDRGENREDTIHKSKAVGEPPLMLAIAVHSALNQAIAASKPGRKMPALDAPATPEQILSCLLS
jgi:xanthine dehydrogenase large subunit